MTTLVALVPSPLLGPAVWGPVAAVAEVEAEQRRLPLAYLRSSVPAGPPLGDGPWAYLAFGQTYEEEAARATASGARLVRLPGQHLHVLVAPQEVAMALGALLEHVTAGT